MKFTASVCLAAMLAAAGPAAAQDAGQIAGVFAAATQGVGQSLGDAMRGGDGVFVWATGRAPLPARPAEAYVVNIESKASSAVEAARLRDARIEAARAVARRFGVSMDVGASGISGGGGHGAAAPSTNPPAKADDSEPAASFTAHTQARFRASDPARIPAFLDALSAAGIDIPAGETGAGGFMALLQQKSAAALGFSTVEAEDAATWDRASEAALAEARRQAGVMAAAAGRPLGEVKQILFLTRATEGAEASVTVAVKYGFAAGK